MPAVVKKIVSPASARSHTRKSNRKSSFRFTSGMIRKIALVFLTGILAWAYQVMRPPPSKLCGHPITAPRIKLRDGRHLAYKEHGVSKDTAKYNFIFVHGTMGSRHGAILPSPELVEELGLYMISFDRPGYGESDPHPERTVKSLAIDIEELADHLKLGSKFYVIGYSMGGQAVWGCIKYIPHRLASAILIAPVINFWWPGFPVDLAKHVYNQQLPQDQWALRVAHYVPWLIYWWNTQKWFPPVSVVAHHPGIFSRQDKELLPKLAMLNQHMALGKQQGEFESVHRDMTVGFGNWEFDPIVMENPFPDKDGIVHLWQGEDDKLVPASLQRYIIGKLPWIHYHEILGAGHLLPYADKMSDVIFKSLQLG